MRSPIFAGVLLMTLCLAAAPGTCPAETPSDDVDPLSTTVERLTKQLAESLAESDQPPQELRLTLHNAWVHHATTAQLDPSGIRRQDGTFTAFRLGDRWRRTALGTPNRRLGRRLYVKQIDAGELQWNGNGLSGTVVAAAGRINPYRDTGEGENMHSMLKAARKPVMNWHIGGLRRVKPAIHRIAIDATVLPGRRVLDLTFHAFAGATRQANVPQPGDTTRLKHRETSALFAKHRKTMYATMVNDANTWVSAEGFTPEWNKGVHGIDGNGLTLKEGRLTGKAVVTLNPDPWVPPRRNGKRTRRIVCHIDAEIVRGSLNGTYKASGDQGEYAGRLTGDVWTAVRGEYCVDGVDGTWTDAIEGRTRPVPASPEQINALQPPQLQLPPDMTLDDDVRRAIDQYRRAHALLLTRDHLPLSQDHSFDASLWMPTPSFTSNDARKRYMDALARWAHAAADGQTPPVGCDDGQFGPFGSVETFSADALPETVNQPGPQKWAAVDRWDVLGPIEQQGRGSWQPARMPAIVPAEGVTYTVTRPRLTRQIAITRRWRGVNLKSGRLQPHPESYRDTWLRQDGYGSYGRHPAAAVFYAHQNDSRHHRWYAFRRIESLRPQSLWIAVRASQQGRLWVNGRLAWDGGPNYQPKAVNVLRVDLRKGTNEFLIEAGRRRVSYTPPSRWDRSYATLWVCTRGAPRSKQEIEDTRKRTDAALAKRESGPRGYFAPGGRTAEDATPPVVWDIERKRNIAWRKDVSYASAAPVISDGKVLLTAEPHTLICLDLVSGKELWRRECDVLSDADGDAEGMTLKTLRATLARIRSLQDQRKDAHRQLRHDEKGTIELSDDRRAELTAEMKGLSDKIGRLEHKAAPLVKRLTDLGIVIDDEKLGRRASAVPVVRDGKVWVWFGTGIAACFTLDGRRVWQRRVALPWSGGMEFSPLLCGKQLILPGTTQRRDEDRHRPFALGALDAATGKVRWVSQPLPMPGTGRYSAGVAPVQVVDGHSVTYALVTPCADVVDARAGKVVARGLFDFIGPTVPMVERDVAYFVGARNGQMAMRFWLTAQGEIAWRQLWRIQRAGTSSHQQTQPGIVADGLLYVPRTSDESGGHHPIPWGQLDVYEGTRGQHLARPNPVVQRSRRIMPLHRAGKWLVYCSSGPSQPTHEQHGAIVYLRPGDRSQIRYRHRLTSDRLHAPPAFAGEKMVLRLGGDIVCVGTGAKDARLRDLEAIGRTAIATIRSEPRLKAKAIEPVKGFKPTSDMPVERLRAHAPPTRWLVAGPIAWDGRTPLPDPNDPKNITPRPGKTVSLGSRSAKLTPIAPEAVLRGGLLKLYRTEGTFYRTSSKIDLGTLTGKKEFCSMVLLTVLYCPGEMAMNLRLDRGTTGWLAGQKVANVQPVLLKRGYYPLLIRTNTTLFPPIGRVTLRPHFNPILSPEKARADWLEKIRQWQDVLKTIRQKAPDSHVGWWARKYLEALKADQDTEDK